MCSSIDMLAVMSESSVGVSSVIPGLDGTFSDSNTAREDVKPKIEDTVRIKGSFTLSRSVV